MIPDSVNILGLDFPVLEMDNYDRHDVFDGEIVFDAQTIKIWGCLSETKKEQVLLHEVVHGILNQLGYDEERDNEQLVQGLAVGLHQALWPFLTGQECTPTNSNS